MSFISPERLWLLLAVLALGVVYVVLQSRRGNYAVRFTNLELLASVAPKNPGWRRHVAATMFLCAMATVVVSFAQPARDERVPRERATVVIALDTSLSMQSTDVSPSRFEAAKDAAASFVDLLPPAINLGLVSFDETAVLRVPPTTDRQRVIQAIGELELNESTAIGDAILTSLAAIETVPPADDGSLAPARIVLMSDGETTVGTPNEVATNRASEAEVPVSTIAFGTEAGTITVPQEPAPIPVPVKPDALREIADSTGGSFFAAATAEELDAVYQDIGSSVGYETELREITAWFVGMALVLLLVTAASSLAWFSRLP